MKETQKTVCTTTRRMLNVVFTAFLCGLCVGVSSGADQNPETLFQQAVNKETSEHDPESAIELYRQVVAQAGSNHLLASKARFHIGYCYERLGKRKEAETVYKQIIIDTQSPRETAQAAEDNFERLLAEDRKEYRLAHTQDVVAENSHPDVDSGSASPVRDNADKQQESHEHGSRIRFKVGPELLISPGYNSFLNDAFKNVSGGYGWVGLRAGVSFSLNQRWALGPEVSGYFNRLTLSSSTSQDTKTNGMIVPALNARYLLYKGGSLDWTVNGEVNVPIILSDLPGYDISGNSAGVGFTTGARIDQWINILIGYKYYPVKVTPTNYLGPLGSSSRTYDFGGPVLSLSLEF